MATGREMLLVTTTDQILGASLEKQLTNSGFEVCIAPDVGAAAALAAARSPVVILVDRRQGRIDGLRASGHLRQIPVVILQPPGMACSEDECAAELAQNVDAVMCTQGYAEVVARVRAIVRRERLRMAPKARYSVGKLEMDVERYEVKVGGLAVALTQKEFQILRQLMLQPARVFTREELLNKVWGEEVALEAHTLDVHIHSLRHKIEHDPAEPKYILTVRGIGYKLAEG